MILTVTVDHTNLAAIFGPTGQDIVATFDPRTEYDRQIWSTLPNMVPSTCR